MSDKNAALPLQTLFQVVRALLCMHALETEAQDQKLKSASLLKLAVVLLFTAFVALIYTS